MLQKDIFEKFKELFPAFADRVEMWFPNRKNSIRLRTYDKHDYAFTYQNVRHWSIETIDVYIERMKGGSKMKC